MPDPRAAIQSSGATDSIVISITLSSVYSSMSYSAAEGVITCISKVANENNVDKTVPT